MVDEVKDELAGIGDEAINIRKAEASALIRFGGGLRSLQKHLVLAS